jgi:GT2 family glycosyltransferase
MMQPKVSIVIVNWNGYHDTVECIESLENIQYDDFNIILIDNGSDSEEVLKLMSTNHRLKVILLRRNLGFALANNVGILVALESKSELILLLNNDTVVDPWFLSEMVRIAVGDRRIGILGPKIYYYNNRNKLWYAGGKLNLYLNHKTKGQNHKDDGQFDDIKQVDWISGACMLIRKSVVDKIGYLPKEYFLGWEDIDYCTNATKNGFKCVYVPRSHIWHKASASFKHHGLSYRQIFLGFRNRVIMRYKYLSAPKFLLFVIAQFLVIIPMHASFYFLIHRDTRRVRSMLSGFIAGFRDMKSKSARYTMPQS